VVGAVYDNNAGGPDAGAAYVFVRDAGSGAWVEAQKLLASDGAQNEFFGSSVAVDGEVVVVGAPEREGHLSHAGGTNAGAAHVFVRDVGSGAWVEAQQLLASDGAESDYFGNSVAVDGEVVVVGAANSDSVGGQDAGAAYVFVRDAGSGAWVEAQKLLASDGAQNEFFGSSVAVDGEVVVVGAERDNNAGGTQAGAAYILAACDDFSSVESVETGSCTSCFGPDAADCLSATCTDGFHSYDSGACEPDACALGAVDCGAGNFCVDAPGNNGYSCAGCGPGHFTVDSHDDIDGMGVTNSAIACNPCPAGKANGQGDGECDSCEPGRSQGSTGQPSCAQCSAGHFTAALASDTDGSGITLGAVACNACPAGRENLQGDSECDSCAPGRSQGSTGQPSCAQCSAGHFTAVLASDTDGSGVTLGAVACNACPAGRENLQGDSECESCAPGYHKGSPGQESCLLCEPGSTTDTLAASAATTCTACDAGLFSAQSTASCAPCSAGHYTTDSDSDSDGDGIVTGAASCNPCPAGKYSGEYPADSTCAACGAGQFGTQGGALTASVCSSCNPGHFTAD
jgi:hypothetical protein